MTKFVATVQVLNRITIPKEILGLEHIEKGSVVEVEIKKVG